MFELIQLKPNTPKLLRYEREGLEVIVLEKVQDVHFYDVAKYDGVLVQTQRRREATEILHEIRANTNPVISLKPVFLSSTLPGYSRISYLFDGTYSDAEFAVRVQSIKEINRRLKETKIDIGLVNYDTSLIQQTLKFCYSRGISLEPQRNRNSAIGFSYPFLSSVIEEKDSIRILKLLDQFSKVGYFAKQTADVIQGCKKCSGGYLNYRETCPRCSSRDLKTEDLIHHFSCAHIAPESAFRKEDHMECPKCDKKLRHIGIDYDKPSAVYTCNSCDHEFQNAKIKALCVDCGHDNELHQLQSFSISNYELTPMGEHAAKYGMYEIHEKPVTSKPKCISLAMFGMFRKQEIERLYNTDTISWEGSIKLNSEMIKGFGENQQQLIREEVQNIISEYLHKADLITSASACWYRFILFDKDEEMVMKIGELVQNNVSKLLNDGLNDHTHDIELLLTSLKTENDRV